MNHILRFFLPFTSFFLALGSGCYSVDLARCVQSSQTPQETLDAAASFYTGPRRDTAAFIAFRDANGRWLTAARGVARVDTGKPPDEHTLFRLASLSKVMLHPAILALERTGRIDLDTPMTSVTEYPLPDIYTTVTLRDLIEHRSGLPRELLNFTDILTVLSCGFFGTDIYRNFNSREQIFTMLSQRKWQAAIREHTPHYSNVGFGLLGVLIENATGQSLDFILKENLCNPLGLTDTTYEPTAEQRTRIADAFSGDVPYCFPRGTRVPAHTLGSGLRATGGLFTTPRDMMRFIDWYWTILDATERATPLPTTPTDRLIGHCRILITPENHRVLYRVGMMYGAATFLAFDLDTHIALFVMRNNTDWPDETGITLLRTLNASRLTSRTALVPEQ